MSACVKMIAPDRARQLLDHARRQRLLEHRQQPLLGRVVDQRAQLLEAELAAETAAAVRSTPGSARRGARGGGR